MSSRYKKSEEYLERASQFIPLGSQTFSKSKTQFPIGVSPFALKKGLGSSVWDLDDNRYIDFISSLHAVSLGYNDSDVLRGVKEQLESGVIFSLPHPIELEVAERIVDLVPCAEMVRYGKNGSDATAGAIRLARAFTKRDHVATCGYHGWQDWYIGTTSKNLGVPLAVQQLTHPFKYNDIDSLNEIFKKFPGEVACVIMEAMNSTYPKPGFLEEVKSLARKNGAILIFDEMITGFRFSNGGAQEYFNVTPDLASFGKGLANGYPLSAIAGRADIMRLMEEVFFSVTFGGEALSLAAANATLKKLKSVPVTEQIASTGKEIIRGVEERIRRYDLNDCLSISGHPAWSFLNFSDSGKFTQFEIKTLFLQEMFARGILILSTHNVSFAHSKEDISKLLSAYDEVFPLLKECIDSKTLLEVLKAKPIVPLFKVR